jgi:short subunit dehydrogenase-like uncharacterized protein
MADRLDVVLLGPTGVTGREVAAYLSRRAPLLGLRWGVAGRDLERVTRAVQGLPNRPEQILHADTSDLESIDALAQSAKVVANLVGPYARHGEPVYAACARHGTHEIDLTGEVDWVREMINRYQADATATGAKIVPTSGFEALPFDLGMLVASRTAHERSGSPVVAVDVAVSIMNDGRLTSIADAVSGGTFTSGIEMLRRGPGLATRDAYFLDPPGSSGSGGYRLWPRRHPGTGAWLAPMFPSPFLNPPTAHRTAALLRLAGDSTFAPQFQYREGTVADAVLPVPRAPFVAPVLASGMAAMQAGLGLVGKAPSPIRSPLAGALLRVGPKSGDGPRPETLDAWRYRLDIHARTASGETADVVVEADGHPGYKSTATMVGEAALLLADPGASLPEGAGFLTPGTALGIDELERFVHAGVHFLVTG